MSLKKEQIRQRLIAGGQVTWPWVRGIGGDSAALRLAVEEVAAMGYPVRREGGPGSTQVAWTVVGDRTQFPSPETAVEGLKRLVEQRRTLQRQDAADRRDLRRRQ